MGHPEIGEHGEAVGSDAFDGEEELPGVQGRVLD